MKSVRVVLLVGIGVCFCACASKGVMINTSPTQVKLSQYRSLRVSVSSEIASGSEMRMLSDEVVRRIKMRNFFETIIATGQSSLQTDLLLNLIIVDMRRVSMQDRAFAGALPGKAKVLVDGNLMDPATGGKIGNFRIEGKSSGGSVFAERPHSSTARALVINTANQYPFSGTTHDRTRTHQGWGLADVGNLYDLRENMMVIDETDVLSPFETAEYEVLVVVGEPALRITMIYTDAPGTTSSSLHRINVLTLKVTSPHFVEYYGNNGLLSGNWSTSGGSESSATSR